MATHNKHSAATSDIKQIFIQRRDKGALRYTKYGALCGGAYGIFSGILLVRDPKFGVEKADLGDYIKGATAFGATFAATGGLLGLPLGAIIGSEEHYILDVPIDTSLSKVDDNQLQR